LQAAALVPGRDAVEVAGGRLALLSDDGASIDLLPGIL